MATTLGEILQAKGDADYANGGAGTAISPELYSSAATNQYLQHAADLTYQANRYLAEQHDRNMQDYLKNINDVDFKNMLPQDSAALMPEYTNVLQDTANNFGVVRNPLSDPATYARLRAGESNFRQKLSQAQQDAAFLQKQNEFVQLHPEFNTPEYQNNVKAFLATPVGQRQYFTATPPKTVDWDALGKTAGTLAQQQYVNAATNGKYITQEEGKKINQDAYFNWFKNLGATQDPYGRSLYDSVVSQYNSLPANLKALYPTVDDFITSQAKAHMPQDQVTGKTLKADEYGTISAQGRENRRTVGMEEAFQGKQDELNRENALVIAGLKDKNELPPEQAAEAKLRNLAVIENTGNIDPDLAQRLYGDNSKFKKKFRDPENPDDDKLVSEVDMPKTTFLNSNIDPDGNLHIRFIDNMTGKEMPEKVITHSSLYNDLDGIFGDKYKPKLATASSAYAQKTFGKTIPTVDDLRSHYHINESTVPDEAKQTSPSLPASNVKQINDKLSDPNYQYTTPSGQKVTMDELRKHYNADQIQNYLTSGVLK